VGLLAFDTLAYSKKLIASGFSVTQAETQAELQSEILSSLVTEKLATKDDIALLKANDEVLNTKINAVDSKISWLISLVSFVGVALASINLWHIFHS
jgi:hypothetical protein